MTSEEVRDKIADVALSWVKTPFYPHQGIKGVGVDCVHLGLRIYQESGLIYKNEKLPRYSLDGGSHLAESAVLKWLNESLYFSEIDFGSIDRGDLITIKIERISHHVGVMIDGHRFVQALRRYGVCITDLRDSTWKKRLQTAWKLSSL